MASQKARLLPPTSYVFYDVHLHSLRPDHCYRAATVDGSNAIFVISALEESQLADAERLVQEKQLAFMTSQVVAGTVELECRFT